MSLFPVHSVDRALSRWEKHLHELTPVERRGSIWLKREDLFAPLGPGGINGGKLRSCIWLLWRMVAEGLPGFVHGASVKSPQHAFASVVAHHFGLRCVTVVGSDPSSAVRNQEVAVAASYGAELVRARIAYNPALQRRAREVAAARGLGLLDYGISTDVARHGEQAVLAFHQLNAAQAANIPDDVDTVVIPAGSCNSCAHLLLGLALHRPAGLRRVVLAGIGPCRVGYYEERLALAERLLGRPVASLYRRRYPDHPDLEARYQGPSDAPLLLEYHDLHARGLFDYQAEAQGVELGGVPMHPTYEAKVVRWLRSARPELLSGGRTLFWVIGARADPAVMQRHAPRGFG